MASGETILVALPPEVAAQVQEAVEAGDYASSSDVVREALRAWGERRHGQVSELADLRQLWLEAREDKTPGVAAGPVLEELERKYQAMADAGR